MWFLCACGLPVSAGTKRGVRQCHLHEEAQHEYSDLVVHKGTVSDDPGILPVRHVREGSSKSVFRRACGVSKTGTPTAGVRR